MLRERFKFDGAVFSDDLSMKGAHGVGDIVSRADAAWQAGCDMVLVCNDSDSVDAVLARWQPDPRDDSTRRIAAMCATGTALDWDALADDAQYRDAVAALKALGEGGSAFAAGPAVGEAP